MIDILCMYIIVYIYIYSVSSILLIYPRCSMYGISTYIWMMFGVNVDEYSAHGAYWYCIYVYIPQ